MFNEIRLHYAILLFFTGALLLTVVRKIEVINDLALIFGVELTVMGIMLTYYWAKDRQNMVQSRKKRLQSITPETEFASSLMGLSKEQTNLVQYFLEMPVFELNKPKEYLELRSIAIPYSFIEDYLNKSRITLPYFYPIRNYSEGSTEMRYAKALTDHLVKEGAMYAASGNRPARLKNWKKLMQAIGWE